VIEFAHAQVAELDHKPAAASAAELRIYALDSARVLRGNEEISLSDWTYAKAREMFFYLLCYSPRTKEQIGVALWPEASSEQLRNNFRVTLHYLRQALGRRDWIVYENEQYALNRDLSYWFDVEAFESSLETARRLRLQATARAIEELEQALALYRRDFLDDFIEGEWFIARREELRQKFLDGLVMLGQLRSEQGEMQRAVEAFERAIREDPYFEIAHRELMRAYAREGERARALRHYQSLIELMQAELGAPPAPETRSLFERIRNGGAV
jgi:DNA-binding SARP family transcriptional activator